MKYIKLFENFDKNYDDILKEVDRFYTDINRSKEEVDYYLSEINNLQKEGGKIYRLVFLYSPDKIDLSDLGKHWCIDRDSISNFFNTLRDGSNEYDSFDDEFKDYDSEDKKLPYIITANIPPNFIDMDYSISQFKALPNELEVNLIGNPKDYLIEEYN